MKLRPYQQIAHDAVLRDLQIHDSSLLVLPTGTGKTVLFAHLAQHFARFGRVLVLAHREELIYQARDKVQAVTGEMPEIEMGDAWADRGGIFAPESRIVISTVQTQIAGCGGKGRMTRFKPEDFALLIVDEAHHAPAATYVKIIAHYRRNPALKVLGVTATPDRADEVALGKVFRHVSFSYQLNDAIADGYLVPVAQRSVFVNGLDFSSVGTTAGDLNVTDLAEVMNYEANLHGIAHPTLELSRGRKTIVFAASVAHAERLCEIFNRHEPGCARFICGATDRATRKQVLRDFHAGRFRILTNVGVLTEGFDEPGIAVVAIARPTKSRALYAQMVGRGTRPLPGVIDDLTTADERRNAIETSIKPDVEVLDFVGNAGRHKLICCADILGGSYADEAVRRAKRKAEEANGQPVDMRRMLDEAQEELERQRQEERRQAETATRQGLVARAKYSVAAIDPFDLLDVRPGREPAWHKGRKPTEKQINLLRRNGITNAAELTFAQASQLIQSIMDRRNQGQCSVRQAKLLQRYGYSPDLTVAEASEIISALEANGWQPLEPVAAGALEGVV